MRKNKLCKVVSSIVIICILFISSFSYNYSALNNSLPNLDINPGPIVKTSEITATIDEPPVNREAEEFLQELQINPYSDNLGVMPSPFAISGTKLTSNKPLPTKFSSREKGWTTQIKDQAEHSFCVMFSCMSTLETFLLKNNIGEYNFSERYMSWAMTRDENGYGWNRIINSNGGCYEGAFGFAAAGFLASNIGPKLESDIPYIHTLNDYKPSNMYTAPTQIDVTDIIYIDVNDMNSIKTAIFDYGAVSTSYASFNQYYSSSCQAYYLPESISKYNLHEISVVGWDDNYSKNNFGTFKPSMDGAWLIKNSYGANFGDEGYFWISYEDSTLFKCNDICPAYSIVAARKQGDIKLYQHDEFGSINTVKIKLKDETSSDIVPMLYSVYDFSSDYRLLDSVKFFTTSIGSKYNIYYAPVDSTGIPVTDKSAMIKLTSGTIEHSGYTSASTSNFTLPTGYGAIALEIISDDNTPTIGVDIDYNPSSIGGFKAKIKDKSCYISYENNITEFKNVANEPAEISLKAVATRDNSPTTSSDTWIQNMNGTWSYKRNSSMLTGWVFDIPGWEGTWFYFDIDGIMKTSWFKVGEKWYYSDSNGAMKTGWIFYNSSWYFMGPGGDMKTSWVSTDSKWYYMNKSGAMLTGWLFDNGNWYYLSPYHGGALIGGGWILDNGNWYYLSDDGKMVTGQININGVIYQFDDNGVWIG